MVDRKNDHTMNDSMLLSIGIAQLQHVFTKAQQWTEQQDSLDHLVQELPQHFFDYTAIAFEGAAMQLAVKALRAQQPLEDWKRIAEDPAHPYPLSSYLGLGMALAQLRLDPSPYITDTAVLLGGRIWAGYGYYNNFFRKRTEVDYLNDEAITVKSLYWQGVGRSCWHKSQGNLDTLQELLLPFKGKPLGALWRGIGIASTYLGIGSMKLWNNLGTLAGTHQMQLAVGAIMVSASIRLTTRNICHDLLLLWCGCSLEEAQKMHQETALQALKEGGEEPFINWLKLIEERLYLSNGSFVSK